MVWAVILFVEFLLTEAIWVKLNKPEGQVSTPVPILAKARGDLRDYQTATLPNGIQVVNVFDNTSRYSAFSVAVTAGSYDNPSEFPGLAHFCEHMVFLGNQKYPGVNSFDNFVASHGGFNNAYTASELTDYFMQVASSASEEGLDRLAHLVQKPLFTEKYVNREVHAIDSEHMKNIETTQWYVNAVMMSLAAPASPVSQFHTGNLQTLLTDPQRHGRNPVDALKIFFNYSYCPARFKVATYGPEPLSVQFNRTLKDFGRIAKGSKQCNHGPFSHKSPFAWPASSLGKWVDIQGTEPQASMWVLFTLPDWSRSYAAAPINYLDWVFSYGGEGSLSQVLSQRVKLATQLKTMADVTSAGAEFWLVLWLTPHGKRNPEKVLDILYSYIAKVNRRGVDEKLYQSLAVKGELDWDWSEPATGSSLVSSLSEQLTHSSPQDVLWARGVIRKPNASLVKLLIKQLHPATMNVAMVDTEMSTANHTQARQLPHYNRTYAVKNMSEVFPGAPERWASWVNGSVGQGAMVTQLVYQFGEIGANICAALSLPKQIKNIQRNFSLVHMHVNSSLLSNSSVTQSLFGPTPKRVSSTVSGRDEFYIRSGWVTTSPRVKVDVTMRPLHTNVFHELPVSDHIRLSVLSQMLDKDLTPKMFDLAAAGASYQFSLSTSGLHVSFSGYTDAVPPLIEGVMAGLHKPMRASDPVAISLFEQVKTSMEQALDTYAGMPFTYALTERNLILTHGAYSREEELEAIRGVTFRSTSSAADDLLFSRPLLATSLAMGNIAPSKALQTTKLIVKSARADTASPSSLTPGNVHYVSPVLNITHPVELRRHNPKRGDPNFVTVVSLLHGIATINDRVKLQILGDIMQPVAYQYLRTNLQLGYVVNAGVGVISNIYYLSIVVQGFVKPADEVEGDIEYVFTKQIPDKLKNMSDSEFQTFVSSYQNSLLSMPKGASQEFSHQWGWISKGGKCPSLIDKLLNASRMLSSKQQLQEIYQSLVFPSRGARQRVVTKLFPSGVPARPSKVAKTKIFQKAGVPAESMQHIENEYDSTVVATTAGSATRKMLAQNSSYYPTDLLC